MLIQALREIGIRELNELQRSVIPKIERGLDILIVAPTGSGKTECAVIPIFKKMLDMKPEGITLLYITPLRALNRDIIKRIERLAKILGFSVAVRHGDTSEFERRRQSLKPPQILITTPETFQLLFLGKNLRNSLKNVRFVIIDEIHEIAESKRGTQLCVALERLRELSNFQTIGLSATIKNVRDVAEFFKIKNVFIWNGNKRYEFKVLKVEDEVKYIAELIDRYDSALVFTNTRQMAEALGLKLKELLDVEVHHSSLSKEVRIDSERKFMNREIRALVCTSSMELGIDIGHVDVVIQFNSPREVRRLIQRVGRSGHKLDRTSIGYVIASNFDEILESWAIVKRAERNEIEETILYKNCLDVLANQIIAMALEYGEIDVRRCYEIIRRSKPFEDLDFEVFMEICEFLNREKLIVLRDGSIRSTKKSRVYFYNNISMIPDEKKLEVIDITSGKRIGYLDESFISCFDGQVLTIKGELWRVVGIDKNVKVEPVKAEGVIPSWTGEEIPVPFEVSQDVGRIRKWISSMLNVLKREEIIEIIKKEFKTNHDACVEVVSKIEQQVKEGFIVPTDNHITIEGDGQVVINCCFGHKVNETLGRIIALFLPKAQIEVDPYRIKICPANACEIERILRSIRPEFVEYLAEKSLIDTRLLQWKIINVAKRFGYLRKDVDLSRINIKNLVLKLKNTPIYHEAVNEIFHDNMNARLTREILERIWNGEIRISVFNDLSPISRIFQFKVRDLIARRDKTVLDAFKKRLEEEECILYCLNCGSKIRTKIKFIRNLECIRCGSRLVACINARRRIEEFDKKDLFRIANLVMCYGLKAVYAMNTYGIGINTAAKILSKPFKDDDEFFRKLLETEKNFIRTRRFWS